MNPWSTNSRRSEQGAPGLSRVTHPRELDDGVGFSNRYQRIDRHYRSIDSPPRIWSDRFRISRPTESDMRNDRFQQGIHHDATRMSKATNPVLAILNGLLGATWRAYAQHQTHVALIEAWGL